MPIVIAGIIWGLFKDPEPATWLDKLSAGFFVGALILFTEAKDFIQKQFTQIKLDKRVAFAKNRTFLFAGLGVFTLLVSIVADKAVPFLFWSAGSCALASVFEWLAAKEYRKVNPLALEVGIHG